MPSSRLFAAALLLAGCGDDDGGSDAAIDGRTSGDSSSPVDAEPVPVTPGQFTYRLTQSGASLSLFTTPFVRKLREGDTAPDERGSGLAISAARGEFEPALLAIAPGPTGTIDIDIDPFDDLAATVELHRIEFVDGVGERLVPVDGSITLLGARPTGIVATAHVADDAPAGEHTTTLHLSVAGGQTLSVPIVLTVFDFALPREIHFSSQLNLGIEPLIPDGGDEEDAKDLLFAHRLTPAAPTWPSGFRYDITWDSAANPNRCAAFYDEPDEGEPYSIHFLAKKYLLGEGWNGVGFPDSMLFQFVDNSTPRPTEFCGEARGDHDGTSDYNAEWSNYLRALAGYLRENGYLDRSYYYVQNEPQDAEDARLAAHLCRIVREAAPGLRIAISEEPKPEIAENEEGGCGYDLWIAHVGAYEEGYAWARQRDHGEQVWFYSLDHDAPPLFNPTNPANDGMEARIVPWASYRHRVRGWAYYDGGRFFEGPVPHVTAELLREGFEDYEYLFLANGGAHPRPFEDSRIEATVRSVASSMTSFTRDADAFMALRHELGRFIEGSRATAPVLSVESDVPRVARYLNFQDPSGPPTADPLVVEGHTCEKVGWTAWDAERGLGWIGENVGDPSIALYGYDDTSGYDERSRSYVYDDYGRKSLFEVEVAPGRYEVGFGVGRPAHGYPGDPHNLVIEGIVAVDDEITTDTAPTIARSVTVDVNDGRLSVEVGGRSASTGEPAYTFLGFLDVVPVD